jgi:preprotein translocase subunit SecG
MEKVLTIVQILVAILMTVCILLQSSNSGLGAAFGGGDVYLTKRGAEKFIFRSTIVLGTLFLVLGFLRLFI